MLYVQFSLPELVHYILHVELVGYILQIALFYE